MRLNAAQRLEEYINNSLRDREAGEVTGVVVTREFYEELRRLGRIEDQFFKYGDEESEVEITFHSADRVTVEMERDRVEFNDEVLRKEDHLSGVLEQCDG